ncbi:MAG TPA: ester cyclase [Pyrinomonadaceae bacterium]|jgi:steroid delta-isomerase-like uncharacterized protein
MSNEPREVLVRWFEEVWNQGREEAIDELFDENGIAHGLGDAQEGLRGPAGFRTVFHQFHNAFPGIHVTVEEAIVEGEMVAVRCRVHGTHNGDGLGFAATSRPVEFTGMSFARIRDGKIVEAWNNFDFQTMFQQLGALPQPSIAPPSDSHSPS